jgi:hypothetical protein
LIGVVAEDMLGENGANPIDFDCGRREGWFLFDDPVGKAFSVVGSLL